MKRVLYIHGYGGGMDPDENPKVQFIRRLPGLSVVAMTTQGDYRPVAYREALAAAGDCDLVVGSSLGGYWAARYHEVTPACAYCVLFNPIVDPAEQLRTIDANLAGQYAKEPPIAPSGEFPGALLVARNDPVVSATASLRVYGARVAVVAYESDDHRLGDAALFGADLERFLKGFLDREPVRQATP